MFEVLFGNKNVQKILLFLFVNGKCYGTGISKLLKVPLTPIQKALEKLEKGNVIISYFEGKTKVYRFNPAFPLLQELEQLLKKAYTLLPAHEKKDYFTFQDEGNWSNEKSRVQVLFTFWEKLSTIRQLIFHAKSQGKEEIGWNGKGKGEVVVEKKGAHLLLFHEKGNWMGKQDELNFKNVFRWTLDRFTGVISLEHLRRGEEHPVFLFHLSPITNHTLSSIDSHVCSDDTYFGKLFFDGHLLRLKWRIIGPKKNEEIDYYYS